ncbi:hypothetical protein BDV59DRAFT_169174 [Aspergillus ambiguus]|uniref:uncharacterized protein n=1 Tax=Aspergillus ambiguus TaxID=176160 RepID=UPI003CCE4F35
MLHQSESVYCIQFVRRNIMGLVEQDPSYFDVQKYGLPINDLDSFATINTFRGTVIWLGLPLQVSISVIKQRICSHQYWKNICRKYCDRDGEYTPDVRIERVYGCTDTLVERRPTFR